MNAYLRRDNGTLKWCLAARFNYTFTTQLGSEYPKNSIFSTCCSQQQSTIIAYTLVSNITSSISSFFFYWRNYSHCLRRGHLICGEGSILPLPPPQQLDHAHFQLSSLQVSLINLGTLKGKKFQKKYSSSASFHHCSNTSKQTTFTKKSFVYYIACTHVA